MCSLSSCASDQIVICVTACIVCHISIIIIAKIKSKLVNRFVYKIIIVYFLGLNQRNIQSIVGKLEGHDYTMDIDFYYGSDFVTVARTNSFVDKTMFIKQVVEAGPRLMITAPGKFGKSTNLNMLKIFLSRNYSKNLLVKNIFKPLEIGKHQRFYLKHYGKRPVVYVNLKTEMTNSYQQALNVFRMAIHEAYLEHEYLLYSEHLTKTNQLLCRTWCGERSSNRVKEEMVMSGLDSLIRMVKKHTNWKVILLIDEYDSVINNALFQVRNISEFNAISNFLSNILFTLIKDSEDDVQLVVVTGISHISSMAFSDISNLNRCYFLGDHPFAEYYGLTENEIASLYLKPIFKRHSENRELVKQFYNGYTSERGGHLYNTYSFLKYLNTGKTITHWNAHAYFSNVVDMIKYKEIAYIFDALLSYESVNLKVQNKISCIDFQNLKKFYTDDDVIVNTDLFLSHLLEIGLLTYTMSNDTGLNGDEVKVKIPNQEVHEILFINLKKHLNSERCNLPMFRSRDYYKFKEELQRFYKSMTGICKEIVGSLLLGRQKQVRRNKL